MNINNGVKPFVRPCYTKLETMKGYDQIKENRSLSQWGMNGSNFKNETLFVSFTAIITTRNG